MSSPSNNTILPEPVPPGDGAQSADAGEQEENQLDAANESLARALAVSFNALRWIMLVLIAVFLASGFFTVAADEVAVRTRFGRIVPGADGEVLYPEGGPYFRWPAPMGQVYRVPTTTRELRIEDSFVFRAAMSDRGGAGRPLSEISQGPRLDPQYDGALLTGDQSIVHARYAVSYKILPENAARFVRNVASVDNIDTAATDRERVFRLADNLVRNVIEQAIVEDVAGTSLDRFLQGARSQSAGPTTAPSSSGEDEASGGTPAAEPPVPQPPAEAEQEPAADGANIEQQPEGGSSVVSQGGEEDRVRVKAQNVLDGLGSGVTLVTVTRTEQMVASNVVIFNNAVAFELARARAARNDAETKRNTELIGVAGPAWEAVLMVIDCYEEAHRLRESEPERFARAERGMEATFSGETLGPILQQLAADLPEDAELRKRLESAMTRYSNERLRGRAGATVSGTAAEASAYVAALEGEAVRFEAMLAIYRQRPELVRQRRLTDTMRQIFSNADAETSFLAPGANLRLLISRERQAELEEESQARARRFEETRSSALRPVAPPQQPQPPQNPPAAGGDPHDH